MTIPLQKSIIYGPVSSRRLGRSLGINCFVPGAKICSLNCLYCQYGYTRVGPAALQNPDSYYPVNEILDDLEVYLADDRGGIDVITLSGNGESSAHPDFPAIVDGMVRLRDRYKPGVDTVILSNSTMLHREAVRSAMKKLDKRIMKLDCGTDSCFKRFNQPVIPVTFEEVVAGLKQMAHIIIQTLFAGGAMGNASKDQVAAWIDRLIGIRPDHVQIYSLARPFPSRQIGVLDRKALDEIAVMVRATGIEVSVY
jgi:wyosine [tRNA(Phe)-imidazoG37] synthetase (radical SAM superfamily)